jgi:hypothetical protein
LGFAHVLTCCTAAPATIPLAMLCLQTKGVKGIVSIKADEGAKWAAIGGAGACVLSLLALWPLMRSSLRQFDEANAEAQKDTEGQGNLKDSEAYRKGVQEDRCVLWHRACMCSIMRQRSDSHVVHVSRIDRSAVNVS